MQTLFEPLDADTHKLKTSVKNLNKTYLAGVKIKELTSKHKLSLNDLKYYLPPLYP